MTFVNGQLNRALFNRDESQANGGGIQPESIPKGLRLSKGFVPSGIQPRTEEPVTPPSTPVYEETTVTN
jgi:hypothetical protein